VVGRKRIKLCRRKIKSNASIETRKTQLKIKKKKKKKKKKKLFSTPS